MPGQHLIYFGIKLLFLDIVRAITPVFSLGPTGYFFGVPELFWIVDVPDDRGTQLLDANPVISEIGIRDGNVHSLPGGRFALNHLDPIASHLCKTFHLLDEPGCFDPSLRELRRVVEAGEDEKLLRVSSLHIERLGKSCPCFWILDGNQGYLLDTRDLANLQHGRLFGRTPHMHMTVYNAFYLRVPFAHCRSPFYFCRPSASVES